MLFNFYKLKLSANILLRIFSIKIPICLDASYLQFFGDDFLRLLLLRYVFCDVVLHLHRGFKGRQYRPRCQPPLPEADLLEHPSLQHLVFDLAAHLEVRAHFMENHEMDWSRASAGSVWSCVGFRLGLGKTEGSTNGSHYSGKFHIVGNRTLRVTKPGGVCKNYDYYNIYKIINTLIFKSHHINQIKLQIIILINQYLLSNIIRILSVFNCFLTLKLLWSEFLFHFIQESTNKCWKMFGTLLQAHIYLNISNFWTAMTKSVAFEMETSS